MNKPMRIDRRRFVIGSAAVGGFDPWAETPW